MGTANERWKRWEGKLVDGKFPLQKWLGGSDHSAVFLTERGGGNRQKAAIKLIAADNLDTNDQLTRWAEGARLTHSHLIRLFGDGRCLIDGTPLLYIVMEYAEENLAEVLPLRALTPAEVSEMLQPATEALAALHRAGFAHSRIKPSNVMAVDNQLKLSADGLRRSGDPGGGQVASAYDAPEVATVGFSPASDMWSLGMTLVAVLTQNEPKDATAQVAVSEAIPQPLRRILQKCLQIDPAQRCTVDDILKEFSMQTVQAQPRVDATPVEPHLPHKTPRWWIVAPIIAAALLAVVWIGGKFIHRQPAAPASETQAVSPQSSGAPNPQSPAPFTGKTSSANENPVPTGTGRGSVLHQVLPDVSRGAQQTITGHIKVSVKVAVDPSGNVSEAKLVSAGPSKYFALRALAAARQWKFNPPHADGKATASEWVLRFQFGRTSTQVYPAELKP
ncbi:MAG TPA: TonB family protein [Candidatus Eremiobacteraceae bacterium]|nr:TonB family protein [Candidatus Eremiobacteraceae bacterium]